jgi:hypothetical protein
MQLPSRGCCLFGRDTFQLDRQIRQWPSALPGLWLPAHLFPVVQVYIALPIPHTFAPAAAEAGLLAWQQQQDPSTGC